MDQDRRRRAELHAALGDPARLGIVEDLATTDRAPSELAERFELPSNLLAHHLGVLERVGLVERVVSAGDRRRRYIRLIRSALTDLALPRAHPAADVLFVCSRNSARSQLAAALWRRHTGHPADSAGTHPAPRVHAGAVAAARRAGLDIAAATPRVMAPDESAELVVTVCDRAHEELEPGAGWWHWSIPDPVEIGTAAAFDAAVVELDTRIRHLT